MSSKNDKTTNEEEEDDVPLLAYDSNFVNNLFESNVISTGDLTIAMVGIVVLIIICVSISILMRGEKPKKRIPKYFKYIVFDHRYGDSMNPYNNIAMPPVDQIMPKKPEVFGNTKMTRGGN